MVFGSSVTPFASSLSADVNLCLIWPGKGKEEFWLKQQIEFAKYQIQKLLERVGFQKQGRLSSL